MVYEDAICRLAYQRGGLECVGTANDLAILPNGSPQPIHYSGTCVRRKTPARFLSPTPLVGLPYAPEGELWNLTGMWRAIRQAPRSPGERCRPWASCCPQE